MKKAWVLILSLFLVSAVWLLVFCFKEKNPINFSEMPEIKTEKELSLEQKIGQMFMVGIEGKSMTAETERLIKELHPGAVLLLGKNIGTEEEIIRLIEDLQKVSVEDTGLPLFIAIDQEGGEVSRIDWVEKTPQSEIETEVQAYEVGKKKAEELKELGINLNLAPLLDKLSLGDYIYPRSFSKDNGVLGNKIVEGQRNGGILSCIKHFPGYGGISFHPENNLAYVENVPEFSQFAEVTGPEFIMISNVVYKDLNENLPFSFLKEGVSLLREKIEGEYLIVSDDLSQHSLLNNFSLRDIIFQPIEAGVDMLIFSGWRSPVRNAFEEAVRLVQEEEIKKERIEESFLKILKLKKEYFKLF